MEKVDRIARAHYIVLRNERWAQSDVVLTDAQWEAHLVDYAWAQEVLAKEA